MTLPPFTADGVLPEGGHRASAEEVQVRLVQEFPTSATRSSIHDFWQRHREALQDLLPVHGQWLDGSFASDKVDPADADVVSFIDGPAFDALPRHRQLLVRQLLLGTHTEALWRCDSHPVVVYPDDHPGRRHTELATRWWQLYFGSQRDGSAKGWVEVQP